MSGYQRLNWQGPLPTLGPGLDQKPGWGVGARWAHRTKMHRAKKLSEPQQG